MTRFDSSANQSAAAEALVCLSIAVDMDFSSGHVRLCDGDHSLQIGGNTYSAIGQLGSIDAVEESTEVIARPLKLNLSGVDASLVATATDEVYQGRDITVYLALWHKTLLTLIDTPDIIWEGRMDTMRIRFNGSNSSIELNCEHRLRREPRIARFTDQDQKLAYSGDRFFDLAPKVAGFRGNWGARPVGASVYVPPSSSGRPIRLRN